MSGFLGNLNISLNPLFGVNILGSQVGSGGIPVIPTPIPVLNSPPVVDTGRTVSSLSSSTAFHSTLFEDLDLRATSTYNFYTSDEQSSFVADPSASLQSLPRYVSLTWNPASAPRDFSLSRKGLRPFDPRTPTVKPALDLSTAINAVANGYVSAGTVNALVVAPIERVDSPSFHEDLFLCSPSAAHVEATSLLDSISEFHVSSIPTPSHRVRVNFIDPSIAGALDPNRINSAVDHTHLASLGAFAKLASGLEVVSEFNQDVPLQNPVPVFPAPAESPTLMYVGYVMERYTLDPSGSMSLSRTVLIDDPGQSSFVDREVVYGGRYSYRIRTIVQWTHGPNVGFFGSSSLDRSPAFDISAGSTSLLCSFFSGEWSDWSRVSVLDEIPPDPPDELTVTPSSQRGQIRIVWKMPNDPRGDISSVTLLRSVGQGGKFGAWETLVSMIPANGAFVDTDVSNIESSKLSYMYSMFSTSFHGLRSVLGERVVASLTDRSRYLGENPLVLAGPAGDDPMGHPRGPMDAHSTELIASKRAVFYVRGGESSLPLFDRTYVVEIQSLATGERVDVSLDVDSTDVDLTSVTTVSSA